MPSENKIIQLAKHHLASGHPLHKDASIKRMLREIDELHERLKFNKQEVDTLEDELTALEKFHSKARKGRKGNVADQTLARLGFDIANRTLDEETERKAVAKEVARLIQKRRTELRLKKQVRERMLKALGQRIKKKIKLQEQLAKKLEDA